MIPIGIVHKLVLLGVPAGVNVRNRVSSIRLQASSGAFFAMRLLQ
jgi:hypothetical protein